MGAFFLYRTETTLNQRAVAELFKDKGFSEPSTYVFGKWTLWHYRKQLLEQEMFSVVTPEDALFAAGTFAYKGLGLQKSLEAIQNDYRAGYLDREKLVGAYCFLFCRQTGIELMTDPIGLFHVFTNEGNTVFSSSFAAVLKAGPRKYKINPEAVTENLLTGYMIGPETSVKGVFLMDSRYRKTFDCPDVTCVSQPLDERMEEPSRVETFDACVDGQLAELDRYFALFKGVVSDAGGVDIGLSGGYDSRVLLLLAKRHYDKVYAHSHFHRAVTADETCAEKISKAVEVPLYRCQEAKQPTEMDTEEFESNIENAAAYNDGRVIHDYSWLVYFRTRWYRESVLRDLRFGMNGLGGELYRNHDNHLYQRVNSREWIKARVMGISLANAVSPKTLSQTLDYLLTKASTALGEDVSSVITHHQTRRYFGELFSVYGAAVRTNIDSQLALSLSPFLDLGPRLASYQSLSHIGLDGRFEAAMISRMSPQLASITSNYGYPFDRRPPLSRLCKCAARGLVPYGMQNRITSLRYAGGNTYSKEVYNQIYQAQPLVRKAVELMRSDMFGLKWDRVIGDYLMLMRTLSMGIMLLKYEDCIDLLAE